MINIFNRIKEYLLKSAQTIADAEDRFVASMFKDEDKDDSNKG